MNEEYFKEINEYLLQKKITITTYRMLIETFERMQLLKIEHKELEEIIIEELGRMEQGEFNHYYFKNTH
jgi:nucleoside-triphosphatase THEP1